jgi:hypothetical protein
MEEVFCWLLKIRSGKLRERGRETGEHQGVLKPLEWVDEGAQATWYEI